MSRKFALITLSLLALCSLTFAMHKKKRVRQNQRAAAPVNLGGIKSVLMGRSACFGTCPAYSIEIFETGKVRYVGKSHVEHVGTYEKIISKNDAVNFLNEFAAIRPDTLKYLYKQRIADLPGFYYFISYADSVKKVINAEEGPELLREWSLRFDRYNTVDDSWKKVE